MNQIVVWILAGILTPLFAKSQQNVGAYFKLALSQYEEGNDELAKATLLESTKLDSEFQQNKYAYIALMARIEYTEAVENKTAELFKEIALIPLSTSNENQYLSDLLGWWENHAAGQVYQFYYSKNEKRLRLITYQKKYNSDYKLLVDVPINVIKTRDGNYFFETIIATEYMPMYQPFLYSITVTT